MSNKAKATAIPPEPHNCFRCRFWSHLELPGILVGMCRRFPPPAPPSPSDRWSEFAITPEMAWCGEFRSSVNPSGIQN